MRHVSAESIAEKQRRISGQSSAAEAGEVAALEEEVQRLRNELSDKEEVGVERNVLFAVVTLFRT